MPQKFAGKACTPNTRTINFKKHLKTTAVYFSVQDKVYLKKHVKTTTTAVYFSVQDKVHLKRHVKTTAVYFSVQQRGLCDASHQNTL